jgi:hypothetical protein
LIANQRNHPVPRGGRRPGAGRKPGSKTMKTREVADRLAQGGVTPLEVMLSVMRRHYGAERFDEAVAVARDAAPYVHPRVGPLPPAAPPVPDAELILRVYGPRATGANLFGGKALTHGTPEKPAG